VRIQCGLQVLSFLVISATLAPLSAKAQSYASPGGAAYAGDGSCANPEAPCGFGAAVQDATDGAGSPVVRLALQDAGTAVFDESLSGASAIDAPVRFEVGASPRGAAGAEGVFRVRGDVVIEAGATLTLARDVELDLLGSASLSIHARGAIEGLGYLVIRSGGFLQLGDPNEPRPHTPKVATVENLRIDAPYLPAVLRDQKWSPAERSH